MRTIVLGIDISAKTLDICIERPQGNEYLEIKNSPAQIKRLLKRFNPDTDEVLIGMENTGKYNHYLYGVLAGTAFNVFVIHPYHLKKSLGLARGKNDKVDSSRIAAFVRKNSADLTPWEPCSQSIATLKILATERKTAVRSRTRYKQKKKEYQYIEDIELRKKLNRINEKNLKDVGLQIRELEKMIKETIALDDPVKKQMELLESIPGVGKVVATAIIVKTEGFRQYTDPRKLACCAGVVPFRYQSGTSVNSRAKVSQMADKSLKTLLNMAAMRAVRMDNDLKIYYDRKVAEGKNCMSVLNAVRNKLVHIMYAVIKNEKMYQNQLVLS
jgi:transposase